MILLGDVIIPAKEVIVQGGTRSYVSLTRKNTCLHGFSLFGMLINTQLQCDNHVLASASFIPIFAQSLRRGTVLEMAARSLALFALTNIL